MNLDREELDLELKRIQVLRERLALEQELEKHARRGNTIGAAKNGIAGIDHVMDRWRKEIVIGIMVAVALFFTLVIVLRFFQE
jgi:hypothetical protein